VSKDYLLLIRENQERYHGFQFKCHTIPDCLTDII
jgi:hypothetical protein